MIWIRGREEGVGGEIVLIKILPFILVITFKQATAAASLLVTVPKKEIDLITGTSCCIK